MALLFVKRDKIVDREMSHCMILWNLLNIFWTTREIIILYKAQIYNVICKYAFNEWITNHTSWSLNHERVLEIEETKNRKFEPAKNIFICDSTYIHKAARLKICRI